LGVTRLTSLLSTRPSPPPAAAAACSSPHLVLVAITKLSSLTLASPSVTTEYVSRPRIADPHVVCNIHFPTVSWGGKQYSQHSGHLHVYCGCSPLPGLSLWRIF
ncbi:hypothetical protein OTU49_005724, partial [Cherax quadricarinatus]